MMDDGIMCCMPTEHTHSNQLIPELSIAASVSGSVNTVALQKGMARTCGHYFTVNTVTLTSAWTVSVGGSIMNMLTAL